MNRNELLKSTAYWTQMLQLDVYEMVARYLDDNNISKAEFARKLGVSKGYISQIFNGDYDHKVSKLVELALACGQVPALKFAPIAAAEEVVAQYNTKTTPWKPMDAGYSPANYVDVPLPHIILQGDILLENSFDASSANGGNKNLKYVA